MDRKFLFANLHLPYDSILKKEDGILELTERVYANESDYQFILGDFNCTENSSVYRYLSGNSTLNGKEVKLWWTDLALVAEEQLGIKREMTLDLSTNPRWKDKRVIDISARFDMIFFDYTYPDGSPRLMDYQCFGKAIDEKSGYCASDHYGVLVDIEI